MSPTPAPDFSTGVMIALKVPDSEAERVALPDGLPPEELHVTLAYLGKLDNLDDGARERLYEVCEALARSTAPLEGEFPAGFGAFDSGDDGRPFWLAPGVDGVHALRERLCTLLAEAGLLPYVSGDYEPFTPHVTLAYLPADQSLPDVSHLSPSPTAWGTLLLSLGPVNHEFPFALSASAAPHSPTAPLRPTPADERYLTAALARHDTGPAAAYGYRTTMPVLRAVYARAQGNPLARVDRFLEALQTRDTATPDADLFPAVTPLTPLGRATHLAARLDPRTAALLASAALARPGSPRRSIALNRSLAAAITAASTPTTDPVLAAAVTSQIRALIADGNSSAARRLRALRQLRDRFGKWIEMGGGIRFKLRSPGAPGGGTWYHGVAVGQDIPNGRVNVKLDDGRLVAVQASKVEKVLATLRRGVRPAVPRPWSPNRPVLTGPLARNGRAGIPKTWSGFKDWLNNRDVVAFDFEATGLNVEFEDRPMELAAARYRNGEVVDRFHTLINPGPGVKVTEGARAAHGITDEDVADAPNPAEAYRQFKAWLGEDPEQVLVAHNANYDMELMQRIAEDAGESLPSLNVVDTFALARAVVPKRDRGGPVDSHGLNPLAEHFGIENPNAHRADADAEVAGQLLPKLLDYAVENSAATTALDDLPGAGTRFREDQAGYRASLRDWRANPLAERSADEIDPDNPPVDDAPIIDELGIPTSVEGGEYATPDEVHAALDDANAELTARITDDSTSAATRDEFAATAREFLNDEDPATRLKELAERADNPVAPMDDAERAAFRAYAEDLQDIAAGIAPNAGPLPAPVAPTPEKAAVDRALEAARVESQREPDFEAGQGRGFQAPEAWQNAIEELQAAVDGGDPETISAAHQAYQDEHNNIFEDVDQTVMDAVEALLNPGGGGSDGTPVDPWAVPAPSPSSPPASEDAPVSVPVVTSLPESVQSADLGQFAAVHDMVKELHGELPEESDVANEVAAIGNVIAHIGTRLQNGDMTPEDAIDNLGRVDQAIDMVIGRYLGSELSEDGEQGLIDIQDQIAGLREALSAPQPLPDAGVPEGWTPVGFDEDNNPEHWRGPDGIEITKAADGFYIYHDGEPNEGPFDTFQEAFDEASGGSPTPEGDEPLPADEVAGLFSDFGHLDDFNGGQLVSYNDPMNADELNSLADTLEEEINKPTAFAGFPAGIAAAQRADYEDFIRRAREITGAPAPAPAPAPGAAPDWFAEAYEGGPEGSADQFYSTLQVMTDHLGDDQEKFLRQAAQSGLANGGFPAEYVADVSRLWLDPMLGLDPQVGAEGIEVSDNGDELAPVTHGEGVGGYILSGRSGATVWFPDIASALEATNYPSEEWTQHGGREHDGYGFLDGLGGVEPSSPEPTPEHALSEDQYDELLDRVHGFGRLFIDDPDMGPNDTEPAQAVEAAFDGRMTRDELATKFREFADFVDPGDVNPANGDEAMNAADGREAATWFREQADLLSPQAPVREVDQFGAEVPEGLTKHRTTNVPGGSPVDTYGPPDDENSPVTVKVSTRNGRATYVVAVGGRARSNHYNWADAMQGYESAIAGDADIRAQRDAERLRADNAAAAVDAINQRRMDNNLDNSDRPLPEGWTRAATPGGEIMMLGPDGYRAFSDPDGSIQLVHRVPGGGFAVVGENPINDWSEVPALIEQDLPGRLSESRDRAAENLARMGFDEATVAAFRAETDPDAAREIIRSSPLGQEIIAAGVDAEGADLMNRQQREAFQRASDLKSTLMVVERLAPPAAPAAEDDGGLNFDLLQHAVEAPELEAFEDRNGDGPLRDKLQRIIDDLESGNITPQEAADEVRDEYQWYYNAENDTVADAIAVIADEIAAHGDNVQPPPASPESPETPPIPPAPESPPAPAAPEAPAEPEAPVAPDASPPAPAAPGGAPAGMENRYHADGVINDRAGNQLRADQRVRAQRDGREGTVVAVQQQPPYVRIRFDDGRVAVRAGGQVVGINAAPAAPDAPAVQAPDVAAPARPVLNDSTIASVAQGIEDMHAEGARQGYPLVPAIGGARREIQGAIAAANAGNREEAIAALQRAVAGYDAGIAEPGFNSRSGFGRSVKLRRDAAQGLLDRINGSDAPPPPAEMPNVDEIHGVREQIPRQIGANGHRHPGMVDWRNGGYALDDALVNLGAGNNVSALADLDRALLKLRAGNRDPALIENVKQWRDALEAHINAPAAAQAPGAPGAPVAARRNGGPADLVEGRNPADFLEPLEGNFGAIAPSPDTPGVQVNGERLPRADAARPNATLADYEKYGDRAGQILEAAQKRAGLDAIQAAGAEGDYVKVQQIAASIFGADGQTVFGSKGYTVTVESANASNDRMSFSFAIKDENGNRIRNARLQRSFIKDSSGEWHVYNAYMELPAASRGSGFATAWNRHTENWAIANGFKYTKVGAGLSHGGAVWALDGFGWSRGYGVGREAEGLLHGIERNARTPAEREQVRVLRERISAAKAAGDYDMVPLPLELALVGWRPGAKSGDWAGFKGLKGTSWTGVKQLDPEHHEYKIARGYDRARAASDRVRAKENVANKVSAEFADGIRQGTIDAGLDATERQEVAGILAGKRSLAGLTPPTKRKLADWVRGEFQRTQIDPDRVESMYSLLRALRGEENADSPAENLEAARELQNVPFSDFEQGQVPGWNVRLLTRAADGSGVNATFMVTHQASGQVFYVKRDTGYEQYRNSDADGRNSEFDVAMLLNNVGWHGVNHALPSIADDDVIIMQRVGDNVDLKDRPKNAQKIQNRNTIAMNNLANFDEPLRMLVLDAVLGNGDRHENNWQLAQGQDSRWYMYPIDHGLAGGGSGWYAHNQGLPTVLGQISHYQAYRGLKDLRDRLGDAQFNTVLQQIINDYKSGVVAGQGQFLDQTFAQNVTNRLNELARNPRLLTAHLR